MFGKYNGFVSKARVSCMHVFSSNFRMLHSKAYMQAIWTTGWNKICLPTNMNLAPTTRIREFTIDSKNINSNSVNCKSCTISHCPTIPYGLAF